jgi:O-antigen/teichoic acid export membrane protein
MASLAATIARNVLSNWVGVALEASVGFVLAPFIIARVGDTGYGIWALVVAFTGSFGLLNLGLRPATNKYVAQFRALGDYTALNATVNTALTISSLAGGAVLLASLSLSRFPAEVFRIPLNYLHEAQLVTILVGVQVALALPAAIIGGILSGLQRYDLHCLIGSSMTVLRAGALLAFLSQFPSIGVLALINLITNLGSHLLTLVAVRHVCPQIRLALIAPRMNNIRPLFRYSGLVVIIHTAVRMIHYADSLVIAYFLPVSAVTPFAIAGKVADLGRVIIGETSNVLSPAASHLQASRQLGALQTMLDYTTKMLLLLVIPLTLGFILLGTPFISLWMGSQYSLSADILAVLALGQLFSFPQQSLRAMLYGMGEHRFLAYTTAVEGSLNLTLSVILVQHYGLLGVAWGTTIPSIAVAVFMLPRIGCRILGLSVWTHFRRAYLLPLCTSFVFVGYVLLVTRVVPPVTWSRFAAVAVTSSLLYLAATLPIALEPSERDKLFGSVRETLGHRQARSTVAAR